MRALTGLRGMALGATWRGGPLGMTLGVTMLALAALAVSPARADDDQALILQVHLGIANALNEALESARSQRPVPWSDPSGNLKGLITAYPPMMKNGRPCRSFKYVVSGAAQEVTDTGLYCRDPTGFWSPAGMPDIVAMRQIAPVSPASPGAQPAAPEGAPQGPPPDQELTAVAQPNPSILQLQKNLVRLAYEAGPTDGLRAPGFETALQQFQGDEGLPQGSNPDAIRRAIAVSAAAIARADRGGTCETPANSQGGTLVCGRRR